MSNQFTIAGLGEILWDIFPDKKRLGGAPANFACHCQQLGNQAFPVCAIGRDGLGTKTLEKLCRLGVSIRWIQVSETHPTGRVLVTLDDAGKPCYDIVENIAWDDLSLTPELVEFAKGLDAVCFGTLAQRTKTTRDSIRKFLGHMPKDSLRIFDVNLRPPFFSKQVVEQSLRLANVLKLSDEELPVLSAWFDLAGEVPRQLATLRELFKLNLIAYTRGSEGSILSMADGSDDYPGKPVRVVDSVGAGDSFTAALCTGLLRGWPLTKINRFANDVAGFVCSKNGATPTLPANLTGEQVSS